MRISRDTVRLLGLYGLFSLCVLVLVSLSNQLLVGSTLLDNDELRFFLLSENRLALSALERLNFTADFVLYDQLLQFTSWLSPEWLKSLAVATKLVSWIASLISVYFCHMTFKNQKNYRPLYTLLVFMTPIILYYSISGVRDALVGTVFLLFCAVLVSNVRRKAIALLAIGALALGFRLETALVLLGFYLIYVCLRSRPGLGMAVLVSIALVGCFVLAVSFQQTIYAYIDVVSGGENSTGLLATMRSTPFPVDWLLMGLLNVLGSLPTLNYLEIASLYEFQFYGIALNPEAGAGTIAPSKMLLYLGIIFQNALFIFVVAQVLIVSRKLLRRDVLSEYDALFLSAVLLLFAIGRISIEHGKGSMFYPIIIMYCLLNIDRVRPYRRTLVILAPIVTMIPLALALRA